MKYQPTCADCAFFDSEDVMGAAWFRFHQCIVTSEDQACKDVLENRCHLTEVAFFPATEKCNDLDL